MTPVNRFVSLRATEYMIGPSLSGTARRFIGGLVLLPIITAVWIDIKIASVVIMVLAVGMAYEFSKMLKLSVIMAIVLILLIALQSLPVWVFDAGVVWHSGLAAVSSGIIMMYRGALAGLFAIALSICLYFSTILLNQTNGHWLLLLLAAVVAACDCAAYFVGRSLGGVKLAPLISPNKTLSGSVGGIVAAIVVMVAFLEYRHWQRLPVGTHHRLRCRRSVVFGGWRCGFIANWRFAGICSKTTLKCQRQWINIARSWRFA